MLMTQVYEILNTITTEILGEEVIVNEDLSNVVDIGRAFENLDNGLDNYVRRLQDHIGRMVFVDRVYAGRAPRVLMDGWEYGSILEKVRAALPEATENESWNLQDGASYDPNIFTAPQVSVKFFNKRVTFEIPISITEKQVKSSFSNATQLNAFYSMIQTAIENSMTVKLDSLIMRTINSAIAETIHSEYPSGSGYNASSGVRAVNLLYLYNDQLPSGATPLTAADAVHDPDFIRFASYQMALYSDRLEVISTLFNIGATEKFTPKDRQHFIMLSEFKRAADVYLQSDTFHDEFTKLPEAESVTYWQGSGLDYAFTSTSAINVTTADDHTVNVGGILGVIFDRDTLGVANLDRRVTTNYNPKAEFWNEWHKADAGYFLDLDENCVVFFVA
jgi:hypothetical protein